MNRAVELILKGLRRKLFAQIAPSNMAPISYENNKEECQREIMEALNSDRPFMVARFGSTEMNAIANYIGVRDNPHSVWRYLIGDITEWWWQMTSINQLQSHSGFFPITESNVVRFCELMIKDARQIDILGSWLPLESTISGDLQRAKKFWLGNLEPYYTDSFNKMNWTYALKGKRVLVVHPFTETIKKQYAIKDKLFLNPDFLPEFELLTVKAIQSLGGNCSFSSWFDALDWMKGEMDRLDYDICILGCGAYGLPLAAHAKRTGHKAIHLGGATQLLFGIRGRRWDSQEQYKNLFNKYWVRPDTNETPSTANAVEGGCYW